VLEKVSLIHEIINQFLPILCVKYYTQGIQQI